MLSVHKISSDALDVHAALSLIFTYQSFIRENKAMVFYQAPPYVAEMFRQIDYLLFFGLSVKYLHLPYLNAKMLIAREEYFATKDIRDALRVSDFL